jgi:CRISPR-associated protein Cas2
MVVFSVTSAPQRIRGLLSRYCLEVRAGLFVGRLDKRMRQKLWGAISETATPKTSAVVAWTRGDAAQGFGLKTLGPMAREVVEMDGLLMIAVPPAGQDTAPTEPASTDAA